MVHKRVTPSVDEARNTSSLDYARDDTSLAPRFALRGHNIHPAASSNTTAMARNSGTNVLTAAIAIPTPAMDTGNAMHTGQSSVTTPNIPAMPAARFVPAGQLPRCVRHTMSPTSAESSNAMMPVSTISLLDGSGRSGVHIQPANQPSSQLNNMPQTKSVTRVGSQKVRKERGCIGKV